MANTWTDDQVVRDAISACHVLAVRIPITKQSDHNSGETCAQVIKRLGKTATVYASQEATKHAHGAIRALRAGQAMRTLSSSHKDANELCVVTICRVAGIPF